MTPSSSHLKGRVTFIDKWWWEDSRSLRARVYVGRRRAVVVCASAIPPTPTIANYPQRYFPVPSFFLLFVLFRRDRVCNLDGSQPPCTLPFTSAHNEARCRLVVAHTSGQRAGLALQGQSPATWGAISARWLIPNFTFWHFTLSRCVITIFLSFFAHLGFEGGQRTVGDGWITAQRL